MKTELKDYVVEISGDNYEYSVSRKESESMVMNLEVGEYIRWTGYEGDDEFTFEGKLTELTDEGFVMVSKVGGKYYEMGSSHDDGSIEKIDVIDNFFIKIERKEVTNIKKRKKNKKSKVDMILELLEENPDLVNKRKECISIAVEKGISSVAGCSTFFNEAKKRFNKS